MTQYIYGNPSPIRRLEIKVDKEGRYEAVIFAEPGLDSKLLQLPEHLRLKGLAVTPDISGTEQVLRISGFKGNLAIQRILTEGAFLSGEPQQIITPPEVKDERTILKKLEDNSLQVSGWFYMIGNLATLTSGILRKSTSETITGLSFMSGDLALSFFGHKSDTQQLDDLISGFQTYAKKHNFYIPEDSALSIDMLAKRNGPVDKVARFVQKNAVTIKGISEITAGTAFNVAGFSQGNTGKAAAGMLLVTGFLASIIMPERKKSEFKALQQYEQDRMQGPDERKERYTLTEKIRKLPGVSAIDKKIQERPLIVPSVFAMGNNVATFWGAIQEATKYESRHKDLTDMHEHLSDEFIRVWDASAHFDPHERDIKINEIRGKMHALQHYEVKLGKKKENGRWVPTHEEVKRGKIGDLERAHDKKLYIFNMIQAAAFFIANIFYSISSKTTGGSLEDDKLMQELYTLSANLVSAQPPETRRFVVRNVAEHFASQPEVDKPVEEIEKNIVEKIQQLATNPWLNRVHNAKAAAATAGPQPPSV